MKFKDTLGYQDPLRYTAERKRMLRIQRQCQTAQQRRIAGAAIRTAKYRRNYV